MIKQYETVFIATPVLSEAQMKEAVAKYISFIKDNGGEIVYDEDWGLKQLAYPIQHKTTGFYHLIEFRADSQLIEALETQYHRDERIIRFLTVLLDKNAIAYAEKRRANKTAKSSVASEPAAKEVKNESPAKEAPVQEVSDEKAGSDDKQEGVDVKEVEKSE
jgi:small subunit ribosomal protein S6